MTNKLKAYDDATLALMHQAARYNVESTVFDSLPEMVRKLRIAYKQKLTCKKVFGGFIPRPCDPATGYCLVTSYYIYERTGGNAVWDIMQTPVHWWLQHKQTGETFDVTYTQFDTPFPYHMGKPETRIYTDTEFCKFLRQKAYILGKCAGIE
ncbi:MAG: hypothetical protein K2M34_00010 [Alphaproteobacteria bacterium]|nr:hypothetical protein [Alphaproteobacteria bacterium]